MDKPHHVVIVGGGFGGLYAAQSLKHASVKITLIDKRNFHLFQPLLYQVATGGLSPANIAAPLRAILKEQRNISVKLGEVIGLDAKNKTIQLKDEHQINFDSLIIATGVRHNYFGNDHWESLAPGLKTIEDALEIRSRILMAFEQAELEEDASKREALLTFMIVGGGPTGVELAGALAEISHETLKKNFRSIDPAQARIVLVEGSDRVLGAFKPKLSASAKSQLEGMGVEIQLNTFVTRIEADTATLKQGQKESSLIAKTILWAAGIQASPLGKVISNSTGAELDRIGRVIVEGDLSLKNHPNIYVIGDLAHYAHNLEHPLPGVAPVAMQQGKYIAKCIQFKLSQRDSAPFQYWDKGSMATIGRSKAVADVGFMHFSGFLAWQAWLFIHLLYLVEFDNRLLVLMQWGWNYATRNRSARLITGKFE